MPTALLVSGGLVPFEEYTADSPSISLKRDSRTITRRGRILWENIDAAIAECYPGAPIIYGAHPTVSYLYVDDFSIKPFHPNPADEDVTVTDGVLVHEYAEIEITYSPLNVDRESDGAGGFDLLSRTFTCGGDFMTMPSNSLEWEDIPGKAVQQEEISAAKIIPSVEHQITLHRKTSINWTALRDNIGKVCDGTFEGAADETLLFSGAEVTFKINNVGTKELTLGLNFKERFIKQGANTYGWNHFLRSDGSWKRLKDRAGNLIYPKSTHFADLFR